MLFPTLSINPTYPIHIERLWDTSIMGFGDKIEQRISNHDVVKLAFTVNYDAIETSDKILLENFFESTMGNHKKFTWTNPHEGIDYIVRFANDSLNIEMFSPHIWRVDNIIFNEAI